MECRHIDDIKEIKKDVKSILQRLSKLEVKSSFWGIVGGLLAFMSAYIIQNGFIK